MVASLAATEYGARKPVAILHGLFGAGRNWAGIARRLAGSNSIRHRVVAFDLRNHGASPWAEPMDYPAMAEDVTAAMAARGHRRYALIGHSMGGKTAMLAALQAPEAIERLVVVDIAPAAYAVPYRGYVQAMRGLDLAVIGRRAEAEAGLAGAIPDPAERAFLLQSLVFEEGKPHWQLNLPLLDAAMPVLADWPRPPSGARYDGPVLFVAGGKSSYLRREHEPAIRTLFPKAEIAQIDNAGHWLHVEHPDAFLALVERFLDAD